MRARPHSRHRKDANHDELFAYAGELGAPYIDTSQLGNGKPDGFVFDRRHRGWFPVEVKSGNEKLRPKQQEMRDRFQVDVWRTKADVRASLGLPEVLVDELGRYRK